MLLAAPVVVPGARGGAASTSLGLVIALALAAGMAGACTPGAGAPRSPTVLARGETIGDEVSRFRRAVVRRSGRRVDDAGERALAAFAKALAAIDRHGIEPAEPRALVDAAIAGLESADDDGVEALADAGTRAMATTADPLGGALLAEPEAQTGRDPSRGAGVGVELTMREDAVVVVAPIDGGPAERAGIHGGEKVVAVDGQPVAGMALQEVVAQLRGAEGTAVSVAFDDGGQERVLTMKREVVHLVAVSELATTPTCLAVRVSRFSPGSSAELARILGEASSGAFTGLVLDLRGNAGGVLGEAVGAADLFLDDGRIATAVGRGGSARQEYVARPGGAATRVRVVVLVDSGTASGAEMLAAALRDQGRAMLVGSRTAGVAGVQSVFPLDRERALRLTTSRLWTPSGRPLASGLVPDVADDARPGEGAEADPLVQRGFSLLRCVEAPTEV